LPDYFVEYAQAMMKDNQNFNQNNLFIPGTGSHVTPTAPPMVDYSVEGPQYSYVTTFALSNLKIAPPNLIASSSIFNFYYYTPDGEGNDPIAGDGIGVK